MSLIIVYKHVYLSSKITCIISTFLIKERLLNYLFIIWACFKNLIICAIDVKLYFLKYIDYKTSKLFIKFTAWCCKCSFALYVAFAIYTTIMMAMATLVAVVLLSYSIIDLKYKKL